MFNLLKNKKEKNPKNFMEALESIECLEKHIALLAKSLADFKKENQVFFKKMGFIRFNPFNEVGGDQSFSLALLNGNDDGIVISSLYSRQESRVYAKTVNKGESTYSLSKEEQKAISQAKETFES